MTIEHISTQLLLEEYDKLMEGAKPFPGTRLTQIIKRDLPQVYSSLCLGYPNPYEEKCMETDRHYILEHSMIKYFITKDGCTTKRFKQDVLGHNIEIFDGKDLGTGEDGYMYTGNIYIDGVESGTVTDNGDGAYPRLRLTIDKELEKKLDYECRKMGFIDGLAGMTCQLCAELLDWEDEVQFNK